jgi:hypothetical protein
VNIPALIVFAIVFIVLEILTEKKIRKKFGIHKKEGTWYRTVNSFHQAGEVLIMITFIIFITIMGNGETDLANWITKYGVFLFITVLFIFRAFMEWKFDRKSKEYIIQMFNLIVFVGIFLPVLIFFFS